VKAIREKDEPPAVEQRALPTPERIRRAGADFELGDTGQITMRDSPLERARARKLITTSSIPSDRSIVITWYHAGLADQLQSIDVERIFAADRTNFSGDGEDRSPGLSSATISRGDAGRGKIGSHVLDWVVCRKLRSIRSAIRWAGAAVRKPMPQAVERMKTALDELSKLWGLVR
jgi:hypothetical protein